MSENMMNVTVNAAETTNTTIENKEENAMTIENNTTINAAEAAAEAEKVMTAEEKLAAYEERMASMQAELLEIAFPEITTTTQPFTSAQIVRGFASGKMDSGNTVQRSDVWNDEQRSLFIHSVVSGFPVPQIISLRSDVINEKSGKVITIDDLIDGKQRTTTLRRFKNNELRLGKLAPVVVDEFAYDITGLTYEELPDCIKEKFDTRTFQFVRIDHADDDTVAEIFKRYNNGTPLSAIEKTRVASKELAEIIALGKHPMFTSALTAKAMSKYTNEDMVIKADMMLRVPMSEICLDNKAVRPYTETVHFDEEDKATLNKVFDFALRVSEYLNGRNGEDAKKYKRIGKKVLVRTHFISLVPYFFDAVEQGYAAEDFGDWCVAFFGTDNDQYRIYAGNASSGSNHHSQIASRNRVLKASYEAAENDFRQQSEVDKIVAEEKAEAERVKAEAEAAKEAERLAKEKEKADAKVAKEAEKKAKAKEKAKAIADVKKAAEKLAQAKAKASELNGRKKKTEEPAPAVEEVAEADDMDDDGGDVADLNNYTA